MNKSEKWRKSFKICDVTQLGPNLKKCDQVVSYTDFIALAPFREGCWEGASAIKSV